MSDVCFLYVWYVLGMSKHTFDKPYTYQEHTHNLVWAQITKGQ